MESLCLSSVCALSHIIFREENRTEGKRREEMRKEEKRTEKKGREDKR